jgi:hypothetical protein
VRPATEGGLSVGSYRDEPEQRAALDFSVAHERGDRRVALVLVGKGRHSHPGVIGEQRDDGVDTAALDGGSELPDELAFAPGTGRGGFLSLACRHVFVEGCARALECSFDGRLGGVEHAGRLGAAEAEHVAEHEQRPRPGREMLQGSHEGQADRLSRFVPCMGPWVH